MRKFHSTLAGLTSFLFMQSVCVAAPGTATDSIAISEDQNVFTQLILEGNAAVNNWALRSNALSQAGQGSFGEFSISHNGSSPPFLILPGAQSGIVITDESRVEIGLAPFTFPSATGTPLTLTDSITGGNQPNIHFNTNDGVWELWANSGSMGIFDGTNNGNEGTPFSMKTGAPDWALAVNTNGFIGMGTPDATSKLHVVGDSGASIERLLQLESTAAPQQVFLNSSTGAQWFFAMTGDDSFKVSFAGTGKVEARFQQNGNLQIAGALSQNSDRNSKKNVSEIDGKDVLDKVVNLPISTWEYKADSGVTHLGPMAQDFHAAFGLGQSPTSISTIDTGGVALAAIKGLKQEKDELKAELQKQEERIMQLEMVVAELMRNQSTEIQVGSSH